MTASLCYDHRCNWPVLEGSSSRGQDDDKLSPVADAIKVLLRSEVALGLIHSARGVSHSTWGLVGASNNTDHRNHHAEHGVGRTRPAFGGLAGPGHDEETAGAVFKGNTVGCSHRMQVLPVNRNGRASSDRRE